MKFRSLESTTQMLGIFFSKTLGDSVTIEEIFDVWGRNTDDLAKNKAWLSSTMMHLKHHALVKTIYQRRNNRKTFVGLELTDKGKSILGKREHSTDILVSSPSEPNAVKDNDLNYDYMMKLIARFQRENPNFQVSFSIKLKEE